MEEQHVNNTAPKQTEACFRSTFSCTYTSLADNNTTLMSKVIIRGSQNQALQAEASGVKEEVVLH